MINITGLNCGIKGRISPIKERSCEAVNEYEMINRILISLEEKTGINLDQWIQFVNKSQVTKHRESLIILNPNIA